MGAIPIIGAGLDLIGGAMQQKARDSAYAQNMNELARSAQLEQANAVDALSRGATLAGQAHMRGSSMAAKQRVAYAGSGIDASSGTAADVIGSSTLFSEMDALTAQNNALREAWGHKEVARRYGVQQDMLDQQNDAQQVAMGFNAAKTLLGAASSSVGGGGFMAGGLGNFGAGGK